MAFDQLSNSGSSGGSLSSLYKVSPNRRVLELEVDVDDHQNKQERISYYFGGGSSTAGFNIIDEAGRKSSEIITSDQTMMMMKENSSSTEIHDQYHPKCKLASSDEKKMMMISKKHRYAFETRSHVDILDDGYRWRKYGQKAVKNNNFPRSYYRCTHQGCNVKKQIQRVSKDEGVVITTYEGIHSHPIQNTDNFEHILTQMHIYNTTS